MGALSKSPLTGGIKEANAGGNAGDYLGRLGIKAILVKGWSGVNKVPSFVLEVSGAEARLVDSPEISNLGSYEMAKVLHAEYGDDAAIILNGPAGTFKMASTAVMPHLGRGTRRVGSGDGLQGSQGHRIPEFMRKEKLLPYDVVFDVADEDMGKIFDFDEPKTTR